MKQSRSRWYADTGPTAGWRERKAQREADKRVREGLAIANQLGNSGSYLPDPDFDAFLTEFGS